MYVVLPDIACNGRKVYMIIEFMGLPGSGKTYLCNALVQNLQEDEIRAVNLVDRFRTDFKYKIAHHIAMLGAKVHPVFFRMRREMRSILKNYLTKKAAYSTADIYRYVDQLLEYCFLYYFLKNRKKVYIFDEGIYQQMATMMTNFEVSRSDIEKLLVIIVEHVRIQCVAYEATVEQALWSIQERNRHTCFIDELSGAALLDFLETYQHSCMELGQKPEILHIKRENPLSENLENIKTFMAADKSSFY